MITLCVCIINFCLHSAELVRSSSLVPFVGFGEGIQFQTFLLDEEKSRLFLGAKDHIYLLDPDNINKNPRKVFIYTHTPTHICSCTPASQVFSYFSNVYSADKCVDFFHGLIHNNTKNLSCLTHGLEGNQSVRLNHTSWYAAYQYTK